MQVEDVLYNKILDMMLVLRDTSQEFKIFSAHDIVKLIAHKLKRKTEPAELQYLFRLEQMITDLRLTFEKAKLDAKSSSKAELTDLFPASK